jgi:hypothetical protein
MIQFTVIVNDPVLFNFVCFSIHRYKIEWKTMGCSSQ